MSLSLRTTILATGCFLAIGTSVARAQMPRTSTPPRRATTPRRRDGQHPSRRLLLQRAALHRPSSGQPCPGPGVSLLFLPLLSPHLLLLLLSPRWGFHGGRPRLGMRAATNAPAARMLVATTRTTRTGWGTRHAESQCTGFPGRTAPCWRGTPPDLKGRSVLGAEAGMMMQRRAKDRRKSEMSSGSVRRQC